MTSTDNDTSRLGRRGFLARGGAAAAAGGLMMAGPFSGFASASTHTPGTQGVGRPSKRNGGYGPLIETPDQVTGQYLLALPEGFRYWTFNWTGDPMHDGTPLPGAHDGMASFPVPGQPNKVILVRNHEISEGLPFAGPELTYDPGAGGGTTNAMLNLATGKLLWTGASITGTRRNCAGGPTPWGSWLTCEETTVSFDDTWVDPEGRDVPYQKNHGYVFDVPATVPATTAVVPLTDMGRFSHEAAAVDPATGYVYETEDAGESGFYQFRPTNPYLPGKPGDLTAGGELFMLKIRGADAYDTRPGQDAGNYPFDVEWVKIDEPDPDLGADADSTAAQGINKGAAIFARLEGCWYGDGVIYFVSTSGGVAGDGQVFAYDIAAEKLHLIYESPGAYSADNPDNICVTPWGTLVLCEDGGGSQHLVGLTLEGEAFQFARNSVIIDGSRNDYQKAIIANGGDFTTREWAGANFYGDYLFVNIQTPGITFVITGPWAKGMLVP